MKARDLDPPQRRLLRHCGRIDPNPTKLAPRELEAAGALRGWGLIEVTDGTLPVVDTDEVRADVQYHAKITDLGRKALR